MSSNTISQNYSFSPVNTVSGCQLWLDGADPNGTGIAPANGATISTWVDKSGRGNNATGGSGPTYSTNGISFNGTSQSLSTAYPSSLQNETVFIVSYLNASNYNNYRNMVGTSGTGGRVLYVETNGAFANVAPGLYNGPQTSASAVPFFQNTLYGYTSTFGSPSNTITLYVNATSAASGSLGGNFSAGLTSFIGSGNGANYWQGNILEVIGYAVVLTTSQRQQVEGYLAWKWNLTSNLPANHPYKNSPPFANNPSIPPSLYPSGPIRLAPSSSPFSFFNPRIFSGMNIWLDGADPNGNGSIPANGASVSTWTDKSGSGNNAITGTSAPTYNSSELSINLNGTNQNLLFTNPSNLAVNKAFIFFIVEKRQTASAQHFISGSTEGTNQNLQFGYQSEGAVLEFYASGKTILSMPAYTGNDPVRLWTCIYTGSQRSISLNGGASSSSGAFSQNVTSWTNGGIGRIYAGTIYDIYMPGKYFEYIFYNSLTSSQRQQVEGYLAWKWGLPSQLPSNHPYKNSPPGLTIPVVPQNRQLSNRSFQPTNFSGCSLWLDGADSTSVTISSGTNINTWSDKSGNSRNATQYNTGYATYDSTQKRVAITPTGQLVCSVSPGTFSGGLSAFIVFQKYGANTGYDALVSRTNFGGPFPAPFDTYYDNNITGQARLVGQGTSSNRADFVSSSTTLLNTSTTLYYINIPASVSWIEGINGATPASIAQSATIGTPAYSDVGTQITIGTRSDKYTTANVYMYEIIFYNTTLSTNQRQSVEGYLAWKWNLVGSLPANHPYKKWPPPS